MKKKIYKKRVQVSLTEKNLERLDNYIHALNNSVSYCGVRHKLTISEVINTCIEIVIK